MAEVIETAFVEVRPDTRGFARETKRQVGTQLSTTQAAAPAKVGRAIVGATAAVTGITLGIQGIFSAINTGFDEIKESQQVMAQTNAVLKSTQGIANVTAQDVQNLAGSLSDLSGIDDELIQKGENLLLTFKNVRNELGAGNDIFDRATKSAIDLSVAGFGSVESTSKQLGKALNDPVRGMTALGRAGVTFTQGQKDTVKALVESGNLLGAQRLLLAEVESQVSGSAEAFGQTLPGAIGRTKNAFAELIADGLEPLTPGLASGLNELADFFTEMKNGNDASRDIAEAFRIAKAAVEPLFDAIKGEGPRIRGIFEDVRDMVRSSLPVLRLFATVIGVTIVLAFKLALRSIENVVRVFKLTQDAFRELTQIVLAAVDGILGGFAAMADAASHIPFIGDQFAGVADAINGARESIRGFSRELDGVDGRNVSVDVTINRREEGAAGRAGSVGGGATEGPPKPRGGTVEVGPRELTERRLSQEAEIARLTEETLADDRASLQALIRFYDESAAIARERGLTGRKFVAASLQAQNELRAINQQAADSTRQAAEDARAAAAERADAARAEREATIQANLRIAALSEGNVKDDIAAYRKLIGFLNERVAAARDAGVGLRQAQADLKEAQAELRDIRRDVRQGELDEREELLRDRVTLAGFTEGQGDDEKSLKALILFFRKRVRDLNLTAKERRKYRIALEQTKQDLRDVRKKESDAIDDAAKPDRLSAFDVLQQSASNFAEHAGNLIDANQPFKEASDFTADQAAALTRAKPQAAAVVVEQRTRRDRQIDELIGALDRNTVATVGSTGRVPRGASRGDSGARSGAVARDRRFQEAADSRANIAA